MTKEAGASPRACLGDFFFFWDFGGGGAGGGALDNIWNTDGLNV